MTAGPNGIGPATKRLTEAICAGAVIYTPTPKSSAFRRGRNKVEAAFRAALKMRSVVELTYRDAERSLVPEAQRLLRRQAWHTTRLRLLIFVLWFWSHWLALAIAGLVAIALWWRESLQGLVVAAFSGIVGWIIGLVAGGTP
ncbi:MAG: hypothetical protein KDK12_02010 [Rhodobacteraceae bacterium]|nr:hypothetical protein [Paracoccaceae bacterium]